MNLGGRWRAGIGQVLKKLAKKEQFQEESLIWSAVSWRLENMI